MGKWQGNDGKTMKDNKMERKQPRINRKTI
jgi:hypothetical protein